jgi:hypothetical protein
MKIFKALSKDDEEFPSSGDFESSEDDYVNGGHNVDDDFPPNEDFQGTDDDDGNFSPSEDLNGIDSLKGDDDFPSSEYFHGRSNDIGEDGNHFSSEFDIPLINEIINEDDDGPRNEDHVLNHSAATNQGDRHSLVQSPDNVLLDIPSGDEEIPSSEDDEIVETLQRNIVSRTRTRPFYINPNHSSYTRSRK